MAYPKRRCLDHEPHRPHDWTAGAFWCPGRKVRAQVRIAAWAQFRVDLEQLDVPEDEWELWQ